MFFPKKLYCKKTMLLSGVIATLSGCCGGLRLRQPLHPPLPEVERNEAGGSFAILISYEKPLQHVADAYLVDLKELAEVNGITPDAVLSPGDRILIPPMKPRESSSEEEEHNRHGKLSSPELQPVPFVCGTDIDN